MYFISFLSLCNYNYLQSYGFLAYIQLNIGPFVSKQFLDQFLFFLMLLLKKSHSYRYNFIFQQVVGFFTVSVAGITFCILIALSGILGIVLCTLNNRKGLEDICQSNREANIALSSLTFIVCGALFVFAICGSCFMCMYGQVLGFKTRRERFLEKHQCRIENQLNQEKVFAQNQAMFSLSSKTYGQYDQYR